MRDGESCFMNRRLRKYGGKWGKRRLRKLSSALCLCSAAAASFALPRKPPLLRKAAFGKCKGKGKNLDRFMKMVGGTHIKVQFPVPRFFCHYFRIGAQMIPDLAEFQVCLITNYGVNSRNGGHPPSGGVLSIVK